MCVDRIGPAHGAALVGGRNRVCIPCVTPRIDATISTLCRVLPLPLVGQALAGPGSIGTRIFQRHPCDRFVVPALGIFPVLPLAEKIQIVLRMIVSRIEKLLELRIGYWILVDPERFDVHRVVMETSRSVLPR